MQQVGPGAALSVLRIQTPDTTLFLPVVPWLALTAKMAQLTMMLLLCLTHPTLSLPCFFVLGCNYMVVLIYVQSWMAMKKTEIFSPA